MYYNHSKGCNSMDLLNILYLVILTLALFSACLIGGKKYRGTVLYALAIGGAVNANFFHAGNYPIKIYGLDFGIDFVLYNIFIFCVIVMLLENGKKDAYLLGTSSIIAIMLSAVFQFIAELFSKGYSVTIWENLINFAFSSLASIIVLVIIVELISFFLRRNIIKNKYVLVLIGMGIATILNSPIYYALSGLVLGHAENVGYLLLSSFIGKLLTIGVAVLTLFLLEIIDKKRQEKLNKEA